MSKHQVTKNVQFAASAASCFNQSESTNFRVTLSNHVSVTAVSWKNHSGLLTLTAILLGGLAVPATAQHYSVSETAREKGFTLPPNAQTAIVLQTAPDAACDLHPEGLNDGARTMKLYANAEGYVRVHVTTQQESQQSVRMQLDCEAAGKIATYPLHLRTGSSPTADMPAPGITVPTPKGSRVLPALKDEDARKLSDEDVARLGYPPRPDAAASPDHYATWLDSVSRPITRIPAHLVSRSDISHRPSGVQEGAYTSSNWAGYELRGKTGSFVGVWGEWHVPGIPLTAEAGSPTYSALWVGLDGDGTVDPYTGTTDLVQAGTEQDTYWSGGLAFYNVYAWTELLPNQPTAQDAGLSLNPGDDILVQAGECNSVSNFVMYGGYACFYLWNKTQSQTVQFSIPLGTGYEYFGKEAEWIMERPCLGGCNTATPDYAELADISTPYMWNNYAIPSIAGPPIASNTATRQLTMYNNDINHPDNHKLASATQAAPNKIDFAWLNYH